MKTSLKSKIMTIIICLLFTVNTTAAWGHQTHSTRSNRGRSNGNEVVQIIFGTALLIDTIVNGNSHRRVYVPDHGRQSVIQTAENTRQRSYLRAEQTYSRAVERAHRMYGPNRQYAIQKAQLKYDSAILRADERYTRTVQRSTGGSRTVTIYDRHQRW